MHDWLQIRSKKAHNPRSVSPSLVWPGSLLEMDDIDHRLSTIARMDRLIVLEHGRIIGSGTHAALLANPVPYARMWHRQSGGFAEAAD